MKTLIAAVVGAIVLVSGGIIAASGGEQAQAQASVQKTHTSPSNQISERTGILPTDIKSLPEYETITVNIDLSSYHPEIKEDNANKRVILLKDESGRERYKSVYIKREHHLKIINYQGGLIFNGSIPEETVASTESSLETKSSIPDTIIKLPEYQTLAATTDLSGYSAQIVEDNRGKRIILFKDANAQPKYKTIYVKYTGMVKVIHL